MKDFCDWEIAGKDQANDRRDRVEGRKDQMGQMRGQE
jgi:hypothetical protein